jgi:hypothetical protein
MSSFKEEAIWHDMHNQKLQNLGITGVVETFITA